MNNLDIFHFAMIQNSFELQKVAYHIVLELLFCNK